MTSTGANKAQFEHWNATRQATAWPKRERITLNVTPLLLAALALRPGERVLDIGSGGGLAAIEAAGIVGEGGSVTGFDISEPLTGLASERAKAAGRTNARFIAGDAQTGDIPGAPFDAAMSQFGVMFFDEPVMAFRNIRRHLRDDGRIAFACWQPADKNPWMPGRMLAAYQPKPPPTPHGGPPPGPLAFGDPEYVRGILEQAGFADVSCDQLEIDLVTPVDSIFERETIDALPIDDVAKKQAWEEMQAFAETITGADGLLHMRIAPQIIRARCA